MSLLGAFELALYVVGMSVFMMTLSIVATKMARIVGQRRNARLVAEVRPAVLAAIDEDGASLDLTGRRTKVAEAIAISLLPKLRGADRDALTEMLDASGVIHHAIGGLGSRSAARRQRSAELLGNAGFAAAEHELVRLLDDRDADVRIVAARALGRLGRQSSVDELFRALSERRVPANTASMAVLRIGAIGAPSIVSASQSAVPLVRSTAVELAGSLGLMEARSAIELLLDDDDPTVRTSAAKALGRLSMPSSAAPLIDRLSRALELPVHRSDDDFLVALVEALGRIGHRSCIPVLQTCFMRRHRLSVAATTALFGMGVRRSTRSNRERALAEECIDERPTVVTASRSSRA